MCSFLFAVAVSLRTSKLSLLRNFNARESIYLRHTVVEAEVEVEVEVDCTKGRQCASEVKQAEVIETGVGAIWKENH